MRKACGGEQNKIALVHLEQQINLQRDRLLAGFDQALHNTVRRVRRLVAPRPRAPPFLSLFSRHIAPLGPALQWFGQVGHRSGTTTKKHVDHRRIAHQFLRKPRSNNPPGLEHDEVLRQSRPLS